MNIGELKSELLKKIELLNKNEMELIYGLVQKFLNTVSTEPFDSLSKQQQQGLLNAIEEMDKTEGIAHQKVMSKFKQKYV